MTLGERLLKLREELDLSRAKFGERVGVSGDVIKNLEYERLTRPEQKMPLIKLICENFGVREEWLIDGNGEMFEPTDRRERIMTFAATLPEDGFKTKLIDVLASLDESGWKLMEEYARKLFDNPEYRKDGDEP